jgi:PAS domain S-box-containing protein
MSRTSIGNPSDHPSSADEQDRGGDALQLHAEQARLLYGSVRGSIPGALLVAAALAYGQWPVVDHRLVLGWLSATLAVYLLRLALTWAYYRAAPDTAEAEPWLRRFLLGSMAAGLLWGVGSWLLFPPQVLAHQAFMGMLTAGLTAGAVSSLSASVPALAAFVVLAVAPLAIRLLLTETPVAMLLGGLSLLFLVVVIVGARRINQSIIQNLRLRLEADAREAVLRASEERLQESEEKYRLLFELSEDPMWLIKSDRFVMANDAARRILGYETQEQLMDRHPSQLSPPEQPDGLSSQEKADLMMEIAYRDGYNRYEWLHRRRDGEDIPVEVSLTRIPFQGQPALFVVWRDITERKHSESALIEARVSAERASRAKSEFLATMSHEIRTPLNAVLGMAELLAQSPLDSEQRELIDTIQQSGNALLEIINDILDFSRIEAGRIRLTPIPFNLEQALQEVGRVLAPRAQAKELELILDYAPDCPRCLEGDPGRLRQVVLNLAGNAVKFTEQGHVLIRVGCVAQGQGRVELCISVEDTGIGIPEEVRGHIFEAFTQADSSTTRRYGGTGLGLAITLRLVHAMGGSLGVDSDLGKGSRFCLNVSLPLAETPLATTAVDLAGLRMLLVDDHPLNLEVLQRQLATSGVRTTAVTDAEAALAALVAAHRQGDPYHLALLDQGMPGMDGPTLARHMAEDPDLAAIPRVLLTSSARLGDGQRARDGHFRGYLGKPVSGDTLRRVLAEVLAHRSEEDLDAPLVTRHTVVEAAQPLGPGPPLRRARILLTEDVPVNQQVASAMLQRLGMEVAIAGDGRQALSQVAAGGFDLVLMDCRMPTLDGYAATRMIRAQEQGSSRHLPIIAMTANVLAADQERCFSAGMDDFIAKPIGLADLRRILARWLSPEDPGDGAAGADPPDDGSERPAVERSVLKGLRDALGDAFQDYLSAFELSLTDILSRLETACADGDLGALELQAHSLKSVSLSVGAHPLATMARRLESQAQRGQVERPAAQVIALRREVARVRAWLYAQ